MIKYYCDGCGVEVTEDTGVLAMKELTLEFPDKKVSIAVEVDSTNMKNMNSDSHPVVCASCIAMRFNDWAQKIKLSETAKEGERCQ